MRKPVALLVLLLCLLASHAQATILFAGGEDVDFTCVGNSSCGVTTGSGTFRSSWAREAYLTSNGGAPGGLFETPGFTASSTVWVHGQFCETWNTGACSGDAGGNNSTTSNDEMIRVVDSAGNPTLIVRGTGTAGQLKISSRTSGGTFTDLVTCSSSFIRSLTQLDLYINYGTSGEVSLYSNSIQVCDYTGNVTNGDGSTTLNQVEFSLPLSSGGGYTYSGLWSEIIVATADTRAMNLFTLYPNASGHATQWSNSSGSTPCTSLIGGTAINDSNYVYTGTNPQIEECTVHNAIPVGIYNPLALVMSARLLVGSAGPQHFDFLTRTGSTDYASSEERRLFYITYWVIYLLVAVSAGVLESCIKSLIPGATHEEIHKKMYCMMLAGWIRKYAYSSKDYYYVTTDEDPFSYSYAAAAREKDTLRRKVDIAQAARDVERIPNAVIRTATNGRRSPA